MTATLEDIERNATTVQHELEQSSQQLSAIQAQRDAADAARHAALDDGDVERAREHAAEVDALNLEIARHEPHVHALQAAFQRINGERHRAETEQRLGVQRDVAAAGALRMRQDLDRLRDALAEVRRLAWSLNGQQERVAYDHRELHDLEVAVGLRERVAHPPYPHDVADFFAENPDVTILARTEVR